MRRSILLLPVLLAGCAAPLTPPLSRSQQDVTAIELDYVRSFLVPAASYDLLPRCPQPPGRACSEAATIERIRAAQARLHQKIHALRGLTDAAPNADAAALIADARATLANAERLLPAKAATP